VSFQLQQRNRAVAKHKEEEQEELTKQEGQQQAVAVLPLEDPQ
jgi:hypothetical protein